MEIDLIQRSMGALQSKDFKEVERISRSILVTHPQNLTALSLLGVALAQLGQYVEAESRLRQVLNAKPDSDAMLYNYAVVLKGLNRLPEALDHFSRALTINSAIPDTWNSRGNLFNDLNRPAEAVEDFEKAILLSPRYAEAFANKGRSLHLLKRFSEAFSAFDSATALKPDLTTAWFYRGNALSELKRYDDALAAYNKAVETLSVASRSNTVVNAFGNPTTANPDLAAAWIGCGNVLTALGRYQPALAAFDTALDFKSDVVEAFIGRGKVFMALARPTDAIFEFDKSIALKPRLASSWCDRGAALLQVDRVSEALSSFDKAISLKPDYSEAISRRIFALDFLEVGFEEQQKARKYWWEHVGSAIAQGAPALHCNSRDPRRRLKVGYLALDFRGHSGAIHMLPIFANHDKSQFEITCYSGSDLEDECTNECRLLTDRWRIFASQSDDELCEQIRADQIDILVDLAGHAGNRLGVFARKPAPIQVQAWGHATGTGLPTIDYLFSDPVACPPAVRHMFAETVFDLPCLQSIQPLSIQLNSCPPPMLSKGHATFGVFNRASKISDRALEVWAGILETLPEARILFKHYGFSSTSVQERVLQKFATRGIVAERVTFLGSSSREEHFAAFTEVDISLDTFPQNGGASTWESLQAGVPVVAILGNSLPSRAAGSILSAVGMADWVADSEEEYMAIAVKFVSTPNVLEALRHELPTKIATSAAGDSVVYTKAIDDAYREMWVHYCRINLGSEPNSV